MSLVLSVLYLGCVPDPGTKQEATTVPEACAETDWYLDEDGDGFGAELVTACDAPEGAISVGGDCDDTNIRVNPRAAEICDGVDQDCDGVADDGLATVAAWPDADGDGYGDPAAEGEFCAVPEGWVQDASDCDDTDAQVSPDALEACNGYDDDCDGLVDDDDPVVSGATTWWADVDADGYGSLEAPPIGSCEQPLGYVQGADDCDDADDAIHPGATEICLDLVDQDCDGFTDDYTGVCAPAVRGNGDVVGCDTTSLPVDVGLCTAGVAAVLASGVTFPTVQAAIDTAIAGDVVTICPGVWTETLTVGVSPLVLVGYGSGTSVLSGGGAGGVVDMGTGRELTLIDLSIEDGDRPDGGGLYGADATLCEQSSSFANNVATGGGGVALSGTGTAIFYDVVFYGNEADYDGGGLVVDTYSLTIDTSSFVGNHAGYEAGAAGIDSTSTVVIRTSEFLSNDADNTAGALKYGGWGPAATMDLEEVTFTSNFTGYEGGAMTLGDWDAPTVTAASCLFEGNVSAHEGGAVTMNSWGGGTFLGVLTDFRGNASGSGGAFSVHAWGSPSATFEGCVFDGNAADHGGALDLVPVGSASTIAATLVDCAVTSNVALSNGGAQVDVSGAATLVSTTTDWGTGGTDNTPDDVSGYSYGAGATFTCNRTSCR
jgi:hypothetical protein